MTPKEVRRKYLDIQIRLYKVFADKIEKYGIKMYQEQTQNFRYWAAYFNCRRKTLRLEKLTYDAVHGDEDSRKKLLSDYHDLANYAIMAIQILEENEDGV